MPPMQSKRQIIALLSCLAGIMMALCYCGSPSKEVNVTTNQAKAQESITRWMNSNLEEYPKYTPVQFGELTPRYEKTDRTFQLNDLIEQEQTKNPLNQKKLDSLKTLLDGNRGLLLGYTVLHKYRTTNLAGETKNNESLFFLDTSFRVATILNPEAFDLILDEKIIFRPDSVEK